MNAFNSAMNTSYGRELKTFERSVNSAPNEK